MHDSQNLDFFILFEYPFPLKYYYDPRFISCEVNKDSWLRLSNLRVKFLLALSTRDRFTSEQW